MKKIALGIVLLFAAGLVAVPALASGSQIGYVDFELLFYAHPEYDVKNRELQEAAEKLYEEIQKAAASLETSEEVDKLGSEYEEKFEELEQEVRVILISFILKIIEEVAEGIPVSVVLPENSIIYGGIDLTNDVIEAMYKSYGISVPSSLREIM
ncbi:MAG: hypothetical protein GX335_02075 [Firmicutes bacterium]|nr:hypothetical protein [Bacillota bacterium]